MSEVCKRCGGSMARMDVFAESHRYFPDCVDHLKKVVAELEPRAAFGDQCFQDHCENAYVEQSVAKQLRSRITQLERENAALREGGRG